jgi:hypothetical protein
VDRGFVDEASFSGDMTAVRHLRDAITLTGRRVDTRPLNQLVKRVFGGSRAVVKAAAQTVGQLLGGRGVDRRHPELVEAAVDEVDVRQVGALEQLLDQLAEGLGAHEGYVDNLATTFGRTWTEIEAQDPRNDPPAAVSDLSGYTDGDTIPERPG